MDNCRLFHQITDSACYFLCIYSYVREGFGQVDYVSAGLTSTRSSLCTDVTVIKFAGLCFSNPMMIADIVPLAFATQKIRLYSSAQYPAVESLQQIFAKASASQLE